MESRKEGQLFFAEFPDVRVACTSGESKEGCLRFAPEALQPAFVLYMSDRKDIPATSRIKRKGLRHFTLLAEAKISRLSDDAPDGNRAMAHMLEPCD